MVQQDPVEADELDQLDQASAWPDQPHIEVVSSGGKMYSRERVHVRDVRFLYPADVKVDLVRVAVGELLNCLIGERADLIPRQFRWHDNGDRPRRVLVHASHASNDDAELLNSSAIARSTPI